MILVAALMWYYTQINMGNISPGLLKDYAIVESQAANLSLKEQRQVIGIIESESHFNPKALHLHDMAKECNSRGLVQIRDCNHRDVSIEQAYDPIFSINFLIQNIDKCKTWWRATCPIITDRLVE